MTHTDATGIPPWPVNTHIHLPPNFSAFRTVDEAVDRAAHEGIRVLGASNYYDYTAYERFAERARAAGIVPLFGLEIVARDEALAAAGERANDPGNPGKVYVCGKATTRRAEDLPPDAAAILLRIREGDARRMAEMARRVAGVFREAGWDTGLDADAVRQMVVARHAVPAVTVYLQERHIAMAFQTWAFEHLSPRDRVACLRRALDADVPDAVDPVGAQDLIRARLMKAGRPAFVAEEFVSVQEARALALGFGGIPCYPLHADGPGGFTEFEGSVDALIPRLRAWGFEAVEFITSRNSPEALAAYVPALHRAGFLVTAGTEHNTWEDFPLEPRAKGGAPLPEEARQIFAEGAQALVAHQRAGRNRV